MSSAFRVIEHVIAGQHVREYPTSLKTHQEETLQLSVKQYAPVQTPDPVPANAVTVIAAPGNGFPKETYEPLWDDLYLQLQARGIRIRNIWVAECSNQGASGVLNEHIQGDSTHWFDHSRDLLNMVNHFRDSMSRPIIGIGHSMGCTQLVHLSIMHPRLLSTLILYEPVIISTPSNGPNPALLSTIRRDIWHSREHAVRALTKGLASWDSRARDLYIQYGLRSVPTAVFDPSKDNSIPSDAVTLTTPKHQEAWAYAQPNWESPELDDRLLPDWDRKIERPLEWSRPECLATFRELPQVRPSVLYVFAGKRPLLPLEAQDEIVAVTGTGVGGNGGIEKEKVGKRVMTDAGHLGVFEQVAKAAGLSAEWIGRWYGGWKEEEKFWQSYKAGKSDEEMLKMTKKWVDRVKLPVNTPRERSEKL